MYRTAGQPNINAQEYKSLELPLPPLDIQQKIVSVYRNAQKIQIEKVQKAKKFLESTDDLLLGELGIVLPKVKHRDKLQFEYISSASLSENRIDAIYHLSPLDKFQAGTFPSRKIKSLITSLDNGNAAGKHEQVNPGNGVVQIRPTNIKQNGDLIFDKNIFVPFDFGQKATVKGDVLFNNTNSQEMVGKTSIVDEEIGLHFSNHITRLRVKEDIIIPSFLKEILNSYRKHQIFYALCTNWNNQSGVGKDVLLNLQIPVPSKNIQHKIIDEIQKNRYMAKENINAGKVIMAKAKDEIEQMILS